MCSAPILAGNLLHYALTEEEVAEREAFEESLGGGVRRVLPPAMAARAAARANAHAYARAHC